MTSERVPAGPAYVQAASQVLAAVDSFVSEPAPAADHTAVSQVVVAAARLLTVAHELTPEAGLNADSISATEALTLISALMRAHKINPFDLALWIAHDGGDAGAPVPHRP